MMDGVRERGWTMGATARTHAAPLGRLARDLAGDVVTPGSPDYDRARRVWNGSIDRRPAGIAQCVQPADVATAVRFARAHGLEVAVRSGGHSFPGLSVADDALVIDLRRMGEVAVDRAGRTTTVGAGVLLGEMDRATQKVGMAVPTGAVSHTGVAGLTLGGGIGWLMRRNGLAVDNLRSAHVVTADGRQVRTSDTENADLFWGLRGGGGNFGIVTDLEFEMHPVGPTVLSGLAMWPIDEAERVGAAYRDWCAAAPRDLTSALVLRPAPATDLVPTALHGQLVIGVIFCWSGDLDEGERVVRPMRQLGTPAVDLTARRPFVDHQALLDPSYPHGIWAHVKACDVADVSPDVLDVTLDHARRISSPRSGIVVWQLGGAMADVADGVTAFGGHRRGFTFNISGITAGPAGFDRERAWARDLWHALEPHHRGVYVNFLMDEGAGRVREAYGSARYDRLQALKRAWDPDNVFHLNQNVPPA